MGLPEIGYLRKLSILLDTDTDSLLAGDVVHHDSSWSGVVVLDDNAYGIGADTMIYDKPLIYFLLSYFLLIGIRDITVIGTGKDKDYLDQQFDGGCKYGFKLTAITGGLGDVKTKSSNVMMVYGRCVLYGVGQTRFFQKAMLNREHFTMLVLPKKMNHPSSHVIMDENKKVINSNTDDPLRTQYDFSDIPILFFPSALLPEMANESDIPSYISRYASDNEVYVQMLDRGFVEIEVDTWANVQEASTFMKIVQDKCGMNVYCIEEVAWRRGLISLEQLKQHGEEQADTEYGDYILSLCKRIQDRQRVED